MTLDISHQIDIEAPPDTVWQHLTDTASFPEWNPFVRSLEGELAEGGRLTVRLLAHTGREMTFRPTVLCARAGSELRWRGQFLLPGILDGEHRFLLEELPGGDTRFTQSERFSGLLVGLSRGTLTKTRHGFERMNGALKQRVEAGDRPSDTTDKS